MWVLTAPIHDVGSQIIWLVERFPATSALFVLVILDILSGIGKAVVTRQVSSTISWTGMIRKAMLFLLIGVAAILEPFTAIPVLGDDRVIIEKRLPLMRGISLLFCVTETLSILENAVAAGVPVPRVFRDVLRKIKADTDASLVIVKEASLVNVQTGRLSGEKGDPITGERSATPEERAAAQAQLREIGRRLGDD